MKNKFILALLSIIFTIQIAVFAENSSVINQAEDIASIETIEEQQLLDEDTPENITNEEAQQTSTIPYKQPISKRKLIKKFVLAMLAVGLSSVSLYLGLTVYNKIREDKGERIIKASDGETPLKSPETLSEAVKVFLAKTKW